MLSVTDHLNESLTWNCSSEVVPREQYQVIQLPRDMELFQEARESLQFVGKHIAATFSKGIWRLPMLGASFI